MPVGTGAITPAIPYTKYKPGTCSEQHGDQVQLSCFGKDPANDIKKREYRMEYKEKDIEEGGPHIL
jgi:hypothetical protein